MGIDSVSWAGSRGRWLLMSGLLGLAPAIASSAKPQSDVASACEVETVGIDTSHGNALDAVFFGRAFGQVFLAPESLLSSVTVWRPAGPRASATAVRLFITETKTNPFALAPDPQTILAVGDAKLAPDSSDIPIPLRWEFDPPVALPRRGYFAIALKDDDPYCSGIFTFVVDTLKTYEDGVAWRISPTILCTMGPGVSPREWDLVFWLEFCRPPVAVSEESWGRIKAIYR